MHTSLQLPTEWSSKNMNQIMTFRWLPDLSEKKPTARWGWQMLCNLHPIASLNMVPKTCSTSLAGLLTSCLTCQACPCLSVLWPFSLSERPFHPAAPVGLCPRSPSREGLPQPLYLQCQRTHTHTHTHLAFYWWYHFSFFYSQLGISFSPKHRHHLIAVANCIFLPSLWQRDLC